MASKSHTTLQTQRGCDVLHAALIKGIISVALTVKYHIHV